MNGLTQTTIPQTMLTLSVAKAIQQIFEQPSSSIEALVESITDGK